MKLNRKNKKVISTFFTPLLFLPVFIPLTINSNEKDFISINKAFDDSTVIDNAIFNKALAVPDNSINEFNDYIVSYSDRNIAPVNLTVSPTLNSTNLKQGGATIGMTNNKQTITCTTYDGLLIWSSKLTENKLLKQYYSDVKNISDINNFKVINYAYDKTKKILFVLFGEEKIINKTTSLENLVVFALDINYGFIVIPSSANLFEDNIITSVKNNAAFIFFNSKNQLIVTSANTVNNINESSRIINFDETKNGFDIIKESNDSETNLFFDKFNGMNETDMLVGFVPSSKPGVNYSLWLTTIAPPPYGFYSSASVSFTYYINNQNIYVNINYSSSRQTRSSYNYYVIEVDDEFMITQNNRYVVNHIMNWEGGVNMRGYISEGKQIPPVFDKVYKRFYNLGVNQSQNKEFFGVFLDSYNPVETSFVQFWFDMNSNSKPFGQIPINASTDVDTLYNPTQSDYANVDINIDTWNINTIDYDELSNSFYYSFSGYQEGIENKYFNGYRYIKLVNSVNANNENNNNVVTGGKYTYEDAPYTLSLVNSSTYENINGESNSYFVKHYFNNGNSTTQKRANWLVKSNSVNQQLSLTENSEINFYNASKNISNQIDAEIKKSNILKENKMPSAVNVKDLETIVNNNQVSKNNAIKINQVKGNDESGELILLVDLINSNNFGDNKENQNIKSVYTIFLSINGGYLLNDLVLSFKTNEAVDDLKKKYNLQAILKENNKGFVVQNFIEKVSFLDENITLTESMVQIKEVENSSLQVIISIPIKNSVTDNAILPVGFSKESASKTMIFNNFTGTQTPPFILIPEGKRIVGFFTTMELITIFGISALAALLIVIFICMISKIVSRKRIKIPKYK